MSLRILSIEEGDRLGRVRDALDCLAPGRGPHADLYDTATWLLAWLAGAPVDEARALRVLVAERDAGPVAMLPLVSRGACWTIAGHGFRPRFRPVVGVSEPGPDEREALGLLVEQAARDGMRSLVLPALPSDDPVCAALQDSLSAAGFRVHLRDGSADTIARVDRQPWDEFRRRFRKFERTVKNFSNKAGRLGELQLLEWTGDRTTEGFAFYRQMHARGWKGEMKERTASHRERLVSLAAARGWVRITGLSVAGVPAAAMIWFRLGGRAIAYSTVYDRRLAALSAGTILIWRGLERQFEQEPPEVIDYLPGRGSQKDQLGTDRPPLRSVEAVRGARFAIARSAGEAIRAVGRRLRRREAGRVSVRASAPSPGTTRLRARPAAGVSVRPLELDAGVELYLVVAGGHRSPKQMRDGWDENDRWLVLGNPAQALARLDEHDAPRELVVLGERTTLDGAASSLAAALGRDLDDELAVHHALLPPPATLDS